MRPTPCPKSLETYFFYDRRPIPRYELRWHATKIFFGTAVPGPLAVALVQAEKLFARFNINRDALPINSSRLSPSR